MLAVDVLTGVHALDTRHSCRPVFYSIRSERLLMEQLDYNLLFRWFVRRNVNEKCCGYS